MHAKINHNVSAIIIITFIGLRAVIWIFGKKANNIWAILASHRKKATGEKTNI
jgi:hypothetical protein